MNGLDNISNKILAEAEDQAKEILAGAERQAAEIAEKSEADAARELAEYIPGMGYLVMEDRLGLYG